MSTVLVARKQNLSGKFWWHLNQPVTHTMVGMMKDLFQTNAFIGSYPDQVIMNYKWDEYSVSHEDLYVTPPMQRLVFNMVQTHVIEFLPTVKFPRIWGAPSFDNGLAVNLCGFAESSPKWTLYQFEKGFTTWGLYPEIGKRPIHQGELSTDQSAFGYVHMNRDVLQAHICWSKTPTIHDHECVALLFKVKDPSIKFVNRSEMLWNPEKN